MEHKVKILQVKCGYCGTMFNPDKYCKQCFPKYEEISKKELGDMPRDDSGRIYPGYEYNDRKPINDDNIIFHN
jgi:hypothetical protein